MLSVLRLCDHHLHKVKCYSFSEPMEEEVSKVVYKTPAVIPNQTSQIQHWEVHQLAGREVDPISPNIPQSWPKRMPKISVWLWPIK